MRKPTVLLCLLLLCAAPTGAAIIGHNDVAQIAGLPQSALDSVGQQRWLFTHASVGVNIIEAMNALNGVDAVRYQLHFTYVGNWPQVFTPPANTVPGRVYDGARGTAAAAKFALFDDAVRNLGWHYPLIDAAMDKLCYIDGDANVATYLATMTALEDDYPGTAFVYTTMPLQTTTGDANIAAWNYNQAVRQHCNAGGRILLDIADIESHDPAGNVVTYSSGGLTYERMYNGYTSDGGHLNSEGARRVALGWYAAAAVLATPASAVLPEAAGHATGITAVVPNPFNPVTSVNFRLADAGHARIAVFDARGRLVGDLLDAELGAGDHVAVWRGRDGAGRSVATGVYLIRLTVGNHTSVRRVTLAR